MREKAAGRPAQTGRGKLLSYVILALALVCIILGVAQGDYMDNLRRATTICLECIGLG